MNESDVALLKAALDKWIRGEALSAKDFERVVTLFETRAPQVDTTNTVLAQGLFVRFREAVRRLAEPPQG